MSPNGDSRKIFSRSCSGRPADAHGTVDEVAASPPSEVLGEGGFSAGPAGAEPSSYWKE